MAQVTNCLIMGSGRCGTSALAGALAHSGAFVGYHIVGPSSQQPAGYFEDKWISDWNEGLIQRADSDYRGLFITPVKRDLNLVAGDLAWRARSYFWMRPCALKDPRFAFTYPIWKPLLAQPSICLVLFRNPSDFVASVRRLRADYPDIAEDSGLLMEMWRNAYEHVLANDDGSFYYFAFEQLVSGVAFPKLEKLLGYRIDRTHVQPEMVHGADGPCPEPLAALYNQLKDQTNWG